METLFGKMLMKHIKWTPSQGTNFTPHLHTKSFIPNIAYWNHDLSKANKQRTVESESLDEDSSKELIAVEELLEGKRHNMWAVSKVGMHRYHLKHLKFEEYSGDNLHPDRTVDAILSHAQNYCENAMSIAGMEKEDRSALKVNIPEIGKFWIIPMDVFAMATSPPGLWEWDTMGQDQRKKTFSKLKKLYYDNIYHEFPDGSKTPMVTTPLVELSLDNIPRILSDENGILDFVSSWSQDEEDELGPLSREEFEQLRIYILQTSG